MRRAIVGGMVKVIGAVSLGVAMMMACPAQNDDSAGDTSGASSGADATSDTPTTSASTTSASTTASTTTQGGTTTTTDATSAGGTTGSPPPAGCVPEALELIDLVNAYRGENGLPAIPASPSMCVVGQTHVQDLLDNAPHTQPGGCNLHSWSNAGAWTPCCYTPDHAQAMCMWVKPQELTDYPGFGYENASAGATSPAQALDGWKNSPAHNEVILNQGIWVDHPWQALGAGYNGSFAVLWFGEEPDPAG